MSLLFRLLPLVLVPLLVLYTITLLPKYLKFKESQYKIESGNSFFKTILDKGLYGEFLTFLELEKLNIQKKILTNIYVPKEDGKTTEIDLVMITETGIYVIESKNYSGWIFGSENNKNWTQTLPNKQKYKFLNPIWQNKGHIKALENVLELNNDKICKSYIVFSERCTLKDISVSDYNIKVLNRNNLTREINFDIMTSEKMIKLDNLFLIYAKLKKYSLADDMTKQAHIDGINKF